MHLIRLRRWLTLVIRCAVSELDRLMPLAEPGESWQLTLQTRPWQRHLNTLLDCLT